MKMKILSTYFLLKVICLGLSLPTVACDSFLEIDPSKTELITPAVFSSNSTANAAMLSIYARMATDAGVPSKEISLKTGLLSDEFVNYSTNQQVLEFYTNSLTINNTNIIGNLWTPYYNLIFQCNAVLEGLKDNTKVSSAVNKQLTGEAKFTRAYIYFFLANFFGDIPLIETTDYRNNATLRRSSKDDVYKFILADLRDAKILLNQNYVASDGITTTSERVRPNRAAVCTLLARIYLFLEDYKTAEIEANEVINKAGIRCLHQFKN
jgi:hypothetical protein